MVADTGRRLPRGPRPLRAVRGKKQAGGRAAAARNEWPDGGSRGERRGGKEGGEGGGEPLPARGGSRSLRARLRSAPSLSCPARPELLLAAAALTCPRESTRVPLGSLRCFRPAPQDGGASGRNHGGSEVEGWEPPAPPGPLRSCHQPAPRFPLLLTLSVLVRGAPPPLGRRGVARDGGGGGVGRRGGAAPLLPDAAVHGGPGAATRVPSALVPPYRRFRAAGGSAAEGTQPSGKAGGARRGEARAARPCLTGGCARSWWRRRTYAPW